MSYIDLKGIPNGINTLPARRSNVMLFNGNDLRQTTSKQEVCDYNHRFRTDLQ
jgi:hypothetical protein